MSEIDTHRHQLCGDLNKVPIYLMKENCESDGLNLTTRNLLLGGGSGEHNRIVFDILSLASYFLYDFVPIEASKIMQDMIECLDEYGSHQFKNYADFEDALEQLAKLLGEEGEVQPIVEWGGDDWGPFYRNAQSPIHDTPFVEGKGSISSWIQDSLGEYVLIAMLPELLEAAPVETHELLRKFSAFFASSPCFMNVRAYPSGYDFVGGRAARLGEYDVRH